MKTLLLTFVPVLACLVCTLGCAPDVANRQPPGEVLELCRSQSEWTHPGEHAAMYSDLPHSQARLCELIKCQLIHPFELHKFRAELGHEWRFEDLDFSTAGGMLEGLARRGRPELSFSRTPSERLAVGCWHHGLLLSSMLRHQGVPVRMRAGFAGYIGQGSGLHVGHVICETWNEKHNRWLLVDPDRKRVDFSRDEFEFACEAWESIRNGADASTYRSAHYEGAAAVVHLLSVDLRSVLCQESPYWYSPEIVRTDTGSLGTLDGRELAMLDRLAVCLRDPDAHLEELRTIRGTTACLREVDRSEEMRKQLPD